MFVFYNKLMLFIVSIILCVLKVDSSKDDLIKEWQCVNPDCSVPISSGVTTTTYQMPDHELKLKFKVQQPVKVLRKPGKNEANKEIYWISIEEKEGYVSKSFIREMPPFRNNNNLIVVKQDNLSNRKSTISPTPSYQVVEGTTIGIYDQGDLTKSDNNEELYDDVEVEIDKDEEEEKERNEVDSSQNPMLRRVDTPSEVKSNISEHNTTIGNEVLFFPHKSLEDENLSQKDYLQQQEKNNTTEENAGEKLIPPSADSSFERSEPKKYSDSETNESNSANPAEAAVNMSINEKVELNNEGNVSPETVDFAPSTSEIPRKELGALETNITDGGDETNLKLKEVLTNNEEIVNKSNENVMSNQLVDTEVEARSKPDLANNITEGETTKSYVNHYSPEAPVDGEKQESSSETSTVAGNKQLPTSSTTNELLTPPYNHIPTTDSIDNLTTVIPIDTTAPAASVSSTNISSEGFKENVSLSPEEMDKTSQLTGKIPEHTTHSPEEIPHNSSPLPEDIEGNLSPLPKEITENTNQSHAKVTENNSQTPEEIPHNSSPLLEDIEGNSSSLPKDITENTNQSPAKITENISQTPEEISHNSSPLPEDIVGNSSSLPKEITENTNQSPAKITENISQTPHNSSPLPENIEGNSSPLPKEITENTNQSPAKVTENSNQSPAKATENNSQTPEEIPHNSSPLLEDIEGNLSPLPKEITENTNQSHAKVTENNSHSAEEIPHNSSPLLEDIEGNSSPLPKEITENTNQSPAKVTENSNQSPAKATENNSQTPEEIPHNSSPLLEDIEGNSSPLPKEITENTNQSPVKITENNSQTPEEIPHNSSPLLEDIEGNLSPRPKEITENTNQTLEEIPHNSFPSPEYIEESLSTPPEGMNENSSASPEDIEGNSSPPLEEIKENYLSSEDSSPKWYSSIYSLMGSLKDLYSSTVGIPEGEAFSEEPVQSTLMDECENGREISGNYCQKKETDDSPNQPLVHTFEKLLESEIPETSAKDSFSPWTSAKSILLVISAPLLVICFTLGFYYFENLHRDDELVRKNNILSSDLFVLETEKATIEEQLTNTREDLQKIIEEKGVIDNELLSLKEELNRTKEEKINLGERESKLMKKLVMVEQNYNELRKIFSESKTKGDRSALIADIKKLKESIAADHVEISSLKEELQERKTEIKQLSSEYQKVNDAKLTLQERFDKLVVEGQEIAKGYQETLAKMEQTIEENKDVQSKLEDDLTKHKKKCESLLIEKELAESALQKAHGITSSESLAEWLEVKEVRAALMSAEKQVTELTNYKDSLSVQYESAERKVKSLTSEISQLNERYENAEKEKIEALTKLQVLSNYFKEEETQLHEELSMKESQWLQKQSEDSTIYQQMRDLREENVHLKNMVETLNKEILDQETSFKKIINTTEQKAQENWVSFRRVENRLKEVLAEAAQLRNRLTTLETSDNNPEVSGLEVNGDLPPIGSAMSPPFMLHPNEFIPPPPLVPLSQSGNPSSRPPPLGRISSPPLVSGDFIPPPPLINPYDVYSHVHHNPSSPSHLPPPLHKPQPRDLTSVQSSHIPIKHKGSQSSNQSSDSLHDKPPARRSKR